MAITQVTQYNSTPTVVGDYAAQNLHIQAFINQVNNHSFILTDPTATTIPAIALGTYISSGGTLFLVDTANYTILGSVASGNNYIKMSVSGTTLTATWIQDISAYTYNPIYGYLASGTDMILPYLVVYDGSSVYNKYRNEIHNASYGSSIIDKNGREVLALNIEQQTDSYSFTTTTANNTFIFTFGGNVKGIVWLDIVLTLNGDATKTDVTHAILETTTISTNTVSVVARAIKGSTSTTGVIKVYITCATD